jgi:hypothetical protein
MVYFDPGIQGCSNIETISDASNKTFTPKHISDVPVIGKYTVMQVTGKEMIGFAAPESKAAA